MGPDELAAHEVAQSPNIYRDFQTGHLLKTNISQHLKVQPRDDTRSSQTAGCRGGPHVETVPLFHVSWVVFFRQHFWQLRALQYWDIERYLYTSVDNHLLLMFVYKTE